MRFSKLVSGISSLAIAASTFAGLAVTANAADTSLSYSPTVDTYVNYDSADTNYAAATTMTTGYNTLSNNQISFANTKWSVDNIAYMKYDVSSATKGTTTGYDKIAKAELTITVYGTSRNHTAVVGYTACETWDSSLTYNTLPDAMKTSTADSYYTIGSQSATKDTNTTLTYDVTNYVAADEDGILSFFVADTAAGGMTVYSSEYTENTAYVPSLKLTWSDTAQYAVTLTATSDGTTAIDNATITVDGETYASGDKYEDGSEHSYVATAPGYDTYYGTFTVNGAALTKAFTMSAISAAPANTNSTASKSKTDTLFSNSYVSETVNLPITLGTSDTGAIEFDVYSPNDTTVNFTLGNANATGPNVRFTTGAPTFDDNGNVTDKGTTTVTYDVTGSTTKTIGTYTAKQWAHVKIDFVTTTNTSGKGSTDDIRLSSASVTITPTTGSASTANLELRNLAAGFSSGSRTYAFAQVKVGGSANVANSEIYVLAPTVGTLKQVDFGGEINGGTIDGNGVLTIGDSSFYGYKSEIANCSGTATGTFVKTGDTAEDAVTAKLDTTITASDVAIYVISNAELDTALSKITIE